MSWKLILGVTFLAAWLLMIVIGSVRDMGWQRAGRMWATIGGIAGAAAIVGWLIGTGLVETFGHAD